MVARLPPIRGTPYTAATVAASAETTPRTRPRFRFAVDRFSGIYIWGLIILIFALWVPETFLTTTTLRILASDQAVTGMVAVGLVVPLACGVFDLSIGHVLGFTLVATTWMNVNTDISMAVVTLMMVAIGVAVGLANAAMVVKVGVNSFIATLAMSSILQAFILFVSNNRQIAGEFSDEFKSFGRNVVLGLPQPFFYLLGLTLIIWFVLEYTRSGRYAYATGGNPAAARLAGVRTDRFVTVSLIVSAAVAAFAGVVLAAKLGSASLTAGPPKLIPAYTAVFLGSTQIKRGRINAWGTLIAVYLLATGVKGLQLSGTEVWVDDLFNGVTLALAVGIAVYRRRGDAPGGLAP